MNKRPPDCRHSKCIHACGCCPSEYECIRYDYDVGFGEWLCYSYEEGD